MYKDIRIYIHTYIHTYTCVCVLIAPNKKKGTVGTGSAWEVLYSFRPTCVYICVFRALLAFKAP